MTTLPLEDIRWHQRLDSYRRALAQLGKAVALHSQRPLSELERQGLIQAFEFTHEMAWNVMKDYSRSLARVTPLVQHFPCNWWKTERVGWT